MTVQDDLRRLSELDSIYLGTEHYWNCSYDSHYCLHSSGFLPELC